MSRKKYNVAVVGVTGAVGQEMLRVLEQRKFPVNQLLPLASRRSAGKRMHFKGKSVTVRELKEDSFQNIDIALFSAGGSISKAYGPIATATGCVVIDNITRIERSRRFKQNNLALFSGDRFVLNATGNNEQLSRLQLKHLVSQVNFEASLDHPEKFIFLFVEVPFEFSQQLGDLNLLTVQFGNDLGRPIFRKAG